MLIYNIYNCSQWVDNNYLYKISRTLHVCQTLLWNKSKKLWSCVGMQCGRQSRKKNGGELLNMRTIADVSSESSWSDRLSPFKTVVLKSWQHIHKANSWHATGARFQKHGALLLFQLQPESLNMFHYLRFYICIYALHQTLLYEHFSWELLWHNRWIVKQFRQ